MGNSQLARGGPCFGAHTDHRLEQMWLKAFCAGTFTPGESVVTRFGMIPEQGGTGGVGMSPS